MPFPFSHNIAIYFKYLSSCWVQAGIWIERALYDEAPDPGPHRGGCWTHHQAAPLRIKQVRGKTREMTVCRILKINWSTSRWSTNTYDEIKLHPSRLITGGFFFKVPYFIQLCFICRPSDSNVSEDAGIEPKRLQLSHWQSDALTIRLDAIPKLDVIPHPLFLHIGLLVLWLLYGCWAFSSEK